MRSRLRSLFRLQHIHILEAALMGAFFMQGVRFVVGALYSRTASAAIVSALDPAAVATNTAPGIVQPITITGEIGFLGLMVGLPLLAMILGKMRWMAVAAGIFV